MAFEFKVIRRVEFSETDMAGIMHYSNFFRFMESAEHAFYRSLGFSVAASGGRSGVGFPRVHAECDYRRPLRFEDEVEVHLMVREKRLKLLSYLIRFRNLSRSPVEESAQGILTIVCVTHRADGSMGSAAIPIEIANCIEVAPADLLRQAADKPRGS